MISNLSLKLYCDFTCPLTSYKRHISGYFHLTHEHQNAYRYVMCVVALVAALSRHGSRQKSHVSWVTFPESCFPCLSMSHTLCSQPCRNPSFALYALSDDICPCFNYSVNLRPANNAHSLIPSELFPSGILPASATPRPSPALAPDLPVVRPGQRA